MKMTRAYENYLDNPSDLKRNVIYKIEHDVNTSEKIIQKYILELSSLEQLDRYNIKWILSIHKITSNIERIVDQIINVIKFTNTVDIEESRPVIKKFLYYENDMLEWLIDGINTDDNSKLTAIQAHDKYINQLNKRTYKDIVDVINTKKGLTESGLKIVIISRILERIGDYLVIIACSYSRLIEK